MKKLTSAACGALMLLGSTSLVLADPIVGNWKTQSGETAKISKCGGSFCIKLMTGDHKGKTIGRLKNAGGKYDGNITDPADDKEYTGSATVSGSSMRLKGCALKVFCRTQTWNKL